MIKVQCLKHNSLGTKCTSGCYYLQTEVNEPAILVSKLSEWSLISPMSATNWAVMNRGGFESCWGQGFL